MANCRYDLPLRLLALLAVATMASACTRKGSPTTKPSKPASDNLERIPEEARLVVEQIGPIGFVAAEGGTLYIQDSHTTRIVYAMRVRFGDKIFLQPSAHRVIVNGQVAKLDENLISTSHSYRLYFSKG